MRAFFDSRQTAHYPRHFMANGVRLENPETPNRADILKSAAEETGADFDPPRDCGIGPITRVHSPDYIHFLKTIYARWSRMENAAEEVIPNVFPDNRATASYPKSAIGQAGFHQSDTACPIGPETWSSAYWSAQCAITAADAILEDCVTSYALCRPPGHHAFTNMAAGFCYLNNAAIAAARLLDRGQRPAILDIDVHHGNGTQAIFYDRADVFTVSIHADPARFYPFFWGHAHERGTGAGLGANMNLPLTRGSDDAVVQSALDLALAAIDSFGADVIIIALGLDAHVNDPFQGLAVTTPGFTALAEKIASRREPILITQEGGYVSDDLGANLSAFLAPFTRRRA